jgi:hypothetical protein
MTVFIRDSFKHPNLKFFRASFSPVSFARETDRGIHFEKKPVFCIFGKTYHVQRSSTDPSLVDLSCGCPSWGIDAGILLFFIQGKLYD